MNNWRVVVLLAFLLAACTVQPASPPAPPPTFTATPHARSTPSPTPPMQLVLNVWVPDTWISSWDSLAGKALQQQVLDFESTHPQYQVKLHIKKASGAGGILELIEAALPVAPNVLPDLVLFEQASLREAYQKALIGPLELNPEVSADWLPYAQNGVTFGGQIYAIPYLTDVEHAVVVPKDETALPLTWETVLLDGYHVLIPAKGELADAALVAWYLSAGGGLTDERGNPYLERATLETLYRFIRALQDGGWLYPTQVRSFADARDTWDAFARGQGALAAVPAGAYWTAPSGRGVPMPWPGLSVPPVTPVTRLLVWGRVNQDPIRRDAAFALLAWLTAPERMSALSTPAQMLPASRRAIALWQLPAEQEATLLQILDQGVLMPTPLVEQSVRRALQAGLTELLTTPNVTPEMAATVALSKLRE